MRARSFLAALLLIGQAHAQNVATDPVFSVVQSTAPALDIDFMTGTLDPRVTFSRASNATQTSSAGDVVYAPHNFCPYSQDFSQTAYWSGAVGVTFSAISDTDPNGRPSTTIGQVNFSSGANNRFNATSFQTFTLGQTATLSIWAKTASGTQTFRLATYLAGDAQSSDLTATTTWQRFSATVTPGTNAVQYFIIMNGSAGTAGSIEVWGAQLEQNRQASTYLPTTTATVWGPRMDYKTTVNVGWPSTRFYTAQAATGAQDGVIYDSTVTPDGNTGSNLLHVPGTFNSTLHYLYRGFAGRPNTLYTRSIYIKPAGYSYAQVSIENSSFTTNRYANFDFVKGVVVGQTDAATNARIWNVGNGWYRVAVSNTSNATVGNYIGALWVWNQSGGGSFTGDGTSGLNLWGDQYVEAPDPEPYTPATSARGYSTNPYGFSVEAAATNLALYSVGNGAAYVTANAAATAASTTSPYGDGLGTLVTTSNAANAYAQDITVTASTAYVFSFWAKAGTMGSRSYAVYDLTNSAYLVSSRRYDTGLSATAWLRVQVPFTTAVGQTSVRIYTDNNSAVGTGYIWGVQLEAGSAATSYVPTTTASATRAADVAYVNVVGLKGLNGNTGSLFAQLVYEAPAIANNASRWLSFNDGNNPNAGTEFGFEGGSGVDGLLGNQATRTPLNLIVPTTASGAMYRMALSFNAINAASAANFVSYPTATRTAGSTPLSLTVLNFNQPQRFQGQSSLWLQHATYHPAYLGPNWATGKANGATP